MTDSSHSLELDGDQLVPSEAGGRSKLNISDPGSIALLLTFCLSAFGAFVCAFFWMVSRSVWVDEGETLATAPNHALIPVNICAAVSVVSLGLFMAASD